MKRGGGRNQGSRGQSPPYTGRYVNRHNHAGPHSDDASLAHESGPSKWERRKPEGPVSGVSNQFKSMSTSDYPYGSSSAPHGVGKISPNIETSRSVWNVPVAEGQIPKQMESRSFRDLSHYDYFNSLSPPSNSNVKSVESIQPLSGGAKYWTPPVYSTFSRNDSSLTASFGSHDGQFSKDALSGKSASGGSGEEGDLENLDGQQKGYSFDICLKSTGIKLKSSLLTKNREKRNEMKRQESGSNIKILRPGMILLRGYLHLMDQVKLVKSCRDLGKGCGGFYQPGYGDGSKLHLKMMCLGKNWDPMTNSYGNERPVDGSKPPSIPDDFQQIVKRAIQESHDYLKSHSKVRNLEEILPSISPNICIINFYTNTGKLGLHQDKDESPESLLKGLPVVSFSIGDSAEFLYGDERDIDKAEKVVLESGDVLIFGGKSRHIFHGVSSIIPETTPKALKEETILRPGRLNLTFREY